MHRRLLGGFVVSTLLSAMTPLPTFAQVRASERASLSQTVDGTTITVDYARPRARGRKDLFGGEVKWGEVWTPGANWATTIDLSKDVELDGHPVRKGKYSVWMEVKEHGDWTMILDTIPHRFHMEHPKPNASHLRYAVRPESGPDTEVLTWSFPEVRADGATLCMQWGTVRVPLRIKVQPSHAITLAADSARRYLGSYQMTDSDSAAKVTTITLKYEDGSLWSEWDGAWDPALHRMLFIRIADGWFIPAIWKDGAVYDVMSEMVFEFKGEASAASGFDLRGDGDDLWATGVRKE